MRHLLASALLVFLSAPLAAQTCQTKKFKPCIDSAYSAFSKEVHGESCSGEWSCPHQLSLPEARAYVLYQVCSLADNAAKSYCLQAKSVARPIRVLAFDHDDKQWTAYTVSWPDSGIVRTAEPLEKEDGTTPTIFIQQGQGRVVTIEDTNPLLFTTTLGERTSEDITQLANAKKLVTGLATGIKAWTAVNSGNIAFAGDPFSTAIKGAMALAKQADVVSRDLDLLARRATAIREFIQDVSSETGGSIDLRPANAVTRKAAQTDFDKLLEITSGAKEIVECVDSAKLASELIAMDVSDPAALAAKLNELGAALDARRCAGDVFRSLQEFRLSTEAARTADFIGYGDLLRDEVRLEELKKKSAGEKKELENVKARKKAAVEAMRKTLRPFAELNRIPLSRYVSFAAQQKPIVDAIAELESKRADAGAAAENQANFSRAARAVLLRAPRNDVESISSSDVGRFLIAAQEASANWEKVSTQPINIARNANAPSGIVARQEAPITATYKTAPYSSRLWDVSASLVHTDVDAPTFSAVTDPNDGEKFIIAKTADERRSGDVAAFLDYAAIKHLCPQCEPWTHRFGLQIGSSVGSSEPAFFGGISVKLGNYVRVSGGYTTQRITQLNEQEVGDPLAAATDLKTKKAFEDGEYLALSISLGSLKLLSLD